jgi:hypothetical protein
MTVVLDSQLRDLEENLAGVLTSCEFVDRAIDNASSTQLLLVKKQVGLLCFSALDIFFAGWRRAEKYL